MVAVEFALIGGLFLTLLLGVIEIGRAMFVWNTLGEATRRAARLAAVCPINHGAVPLAALLSPPDGSTSSRFLHQMSTANVSLIYLTSTGAQTTAYAEARFVQISVTGYTHQLMIPFLGRDITVPPFTTTLLAESLGYVPETDSRQCFGI